MKIKVEFDEDILKKIIAKYFGYDINDINLSAYDDRAITDIIEAMILP